MARRNKILATVAVMLLFAIFLSTSISSSATPPTPPSMISGTSSYGLQFSGGDGIVIENQSVTFNLSEFPDADRAEYMISNPTGNVNAAYTLYNPTDSEVSIKCALPVSNVPNSYENSGFDADVEKYSLFVNGERVYPEVRHTLNLGSDADTLGFASFISDEYISNGYCSPDTPVTKYTFKLSGAGSLPSFVCFKMDYNESDGRLLYLGESSSDISSYGQAHEKFDYELLVKESGSTYDFYVIGKQPYDFPEFKIYECVESYKKGDEIYGRMELISKETVALSEFVAGFYDVEFGISELDWYNMHAKNICRSIEFGRVDIGFQNSEYYYYGYEYYLSSGFIYELTLAPDERVTLSTSAPLYPSVETKYNPNTYHYSYDFFTPNAEMYDGKINVTINTPYYMLESHRNDYTKTDNGYSVSFNLTEVLSDDSKVTVGSIDFTLCEVENPEVVEDTDSGFGMIFILIVIGIFALFESVLSFIGQVFNWFFGLFNF